MALLEGLVPFAQLHQLCPIFSGLGEGVVRPCEPVAVRVVLGVRVSWLPEEVEVHGEKTRSSPEEGVVEEKA